jgi:hypothetical protein
MKKIILPILALTLITSCKKETTTTTPTTNVVVPAAGTYGVQYVGGTWSNVGITYTNTQNQILYKSYAGNTIKTTYINPNQIKLEVTNTSSPMTEKTVILPLFNKSEGGPGGYSSYNFKNDFWSVSIDENYPGVANKNGITISYSKITESSSEMWNAYRSSAD